MTWQQIDCASASVLGQYSRYWQTEKINKWSEDCNTRARYIHLYFKDVFIYANTFASR